MHNLVYFELPSTDLSETRKFYTDLFGWTLKQTADNYLVIESESGIHGAFYLVTDVLPSQPNLYIDVEDIESTLEKAAELGGIVIEPKHSIGEHGFIGSFSDPGGFQMDVWSPPVKD